MIRECVDAYIHMEDWDNAKRIAEQYDPDLVGYVEERRQNAAEESGQYDQLNPVKALEMYANTGRWEEGIKLAEKQVKTPYYLFNHLNPLLNHLICYFKVGECS